MSNKAIADALGVTYNTVWRYLGPDTNKPERKASKTVTRHKPVSELFTTINTEVTLTGSKHLYKILPERQTMSMVIKSFDATDAVFNLADIDTLIEELAYIRRTYMQ